MVTKQWLMAWVCMQAYSVLSDPAQRQAHDAGDASQHAGFSRTNADDLFAEFFNGGDPFAEVSVLLDSLTQPHCCESQPGSQCVC